MQTIESAERARAPGGQESQDPVVHKLSEVLGGALRAFFEAEGDPHGSAREGSGAALALLGPPGANGSLFPLVHYHGEKQFFPAGLVTLFYLAGAYLEMQHGGLSGDGNLERDILRMLRMGDTDAANLIFDRITGTLSGPELPEANLEMFARRRGRLDALLRRIGIDGTRCEQKIWDRPPYGRDAQFLGLDHSRQNRITAIAAADLLAKIVLGRVGGAEASRQILELLSIDPSQPGADPRARPRLSAGLPPGSRAWGRCAAGSRVLHEAVVVELPGGRRYVLCFLSQGFPPSALEALGRSVAEGIAGIPSP